MKDVILYSNDELTNSLKRLDINSWYDALNYIKHLPYGRNANRYDLSLVINEGHGTCSSKHAFLKQIADLNEIKDVHLILGMYKMNARNTPLVGQVLKTYHLDYIPEAHCYLNIGKKNIDLTTRESKFSDLKNDIISELIIKPNQVNEYKVKYHQLFLKDWLIKNGKNNLDNQLSFDAIWNIREQCIKNLSK